MKTSRIRRVEFHRTKHGRELLLEAAFLSELALFDFSPRPYRLSFYDILLVTKGEGIFTIDGALFDIRPGLVLFTRPGDVRELRAQGLDGACLFFTDEFVKEAFSDERFMSQFAYFNSVRSTGALQLSGEQKTAFLRRFEEMRQEFAVLRVDASHLLRALLYQLLVLLNRWYIKRYGANGERLANTAVEKFEKLVERNYKQHHRVADYARQVNLTPGHLNALCQNCLGRSASKVIHERLTVEAKRILLYTDTSVAELAYKLGFVDPAYFSRFFKRSTGSPPQAFRQHFQSKLA